MANRVIQVSFKEDELWLYDKVKAHSSPGAFIKDVLTEYYNGGNIREATAESAVSNLLMDINF